jgi:hypothetical protein
VLYRLDGKQTSTSFEDLVSATKFQKLVDKFGPAKALKSAPLHCPTVTQPEVLEKIIHLRVSGHVIPTYMSVTGR